MQKITQATIATLENANWFSRVGSLDGIQQPDKIVLLSSWEEAIFHCASLKWENICLRAQNQHRTHLRQRNVDRWLQWNQTVDIVKPTTAALVKRKISAVVQEHLLPQVFEDTVLWDILGTCMETEFSDVVPPAFFANNAHWYLAGHFPCGWDGDFPHGRLCVY